jgi:uncharacterized protein YceK
MTGCGSFLGRMTREPWPYPGVRFTVKQLPAAKPPGVEQLLWLDLPVTVVVDTVLLPIDALEASAP